MPHDKLAITGDRSGGWRERFLKPLELEVRAHGNLFGGKTEIIRGWRERFLKPLEQRARAEELLSQDEALDLSCMICLANPSSRKSLPDEREDTPKEAALRLLVKETMAAVTECARKAKVLSADEYLSYAYAVYRKPALFKLGK